MQLFAGTLQLESLLGRISLVGLCLRDCCWLVRLCAQALCLLHKTGGGMHSLLLSSEDPDTTHLTYPCIERQLLLVLLVAVPHHQH